MADSPGCRGSHLPLIADLPRASLASRTCLSVYLSVCIAYVHPRVCPVAKPVGDVNCCCRSDSSQPAGQPNRLRKPAPRNPKGAVTQFSLPVRWEHGLQTGILSGLCRNGHGRARGENTDTTHPAGTLPSMRQVYRPDTVERLPGPAGLDAARDTKQKLAREGRGPSLVAMLGGFLCAFPSVRPYYAPREGKFHAHTRRCQTQLLAVGGLSTSCGQRRPDEQNPKWKPPNRT